MTAATALKATTFTPRSLREPHPSSPRTASVSAEGLFAGSEDRAFMQMNYAYGPHGGLACGDELAVRMRRCWDQPISMLARWIVERKVVHLVWRSRLLIPVFQFTTADMRVRPVVSSVLAELTDAFDDREIAAWFARPNSWLEDARPVDLVDLDDAAIMEAARVDRFVACG